MEKANLTPLKSIRKHCLDCSGGSPKNVRECEIQDCPLFGFRFGKNARRKGLKKSFDGATHS